MKIFIDAEGAIVGRIGSYSSKELLKGNSVFIINSEKAIISGDRKNILDKVVNLRKKGGTSLKGPKISKAPGRFLKRKIRGMLPYDKPRGRDAYKRLKCFVDNPFKGDETKNAKKIASKKPFKFVTIKQICESLR